MKKFFFGLVTIACALTVSATQAGTVSLTGDVDGSNGGNASGGSFNVVIDLDAGDSLSAGGGIDFAVVAGTADVIKFTTAEIVSGAWDLKSAAVAADGQRVQLNTTALFQAGLPAGGQGQILATINYSVINPAGSTALDFALPSEAGISDGNNATNPDRTSAYQFMSGAITLGSTDVPEPATLAMASLSLIGLVLRRRNG